MHASPVGAKQVEIGLDQFYERLQLAKLEATVLPDSDWAMGERMVVAVQQKDRSLVGSDQVNVARPMIRREDDNADLTVAQQRDHADDTINPSVLEMARVEEL